jgi:hypothetical protein
VSATQGTQHAFSRLFGKRDAQQSVPPAAGTALAVDAATAANTAATPDPSSSTTARTLATILLIVGVVVAIVWHESDKAFKPADGFVVLTGFYVAAQAIERLLELLPAGLGTPQAKADRAVVFPALGFVLAVIAAEWMDLYFLRAVSVTEGNKNLDIIITALAIGGGSAPLHSFITRIQKPAPDGV